MSDADVGNVAIRHAPFIFVSIPVFPLHLPSPPLVVHGRPPKDPSNTIHNVSNCRHARNTANTAPRLASGLALETSATPSALDGLEVPQTERGAVAVERPRVDLRRELINVQGRTRVVELDAQCIERLSRREYVHDLLGVHSCARRGGVAIVRRCHQFRGTDRCTRNTGRTR